MAKKSFFGVRIVFPVIQPYKRTALKENYLRSIYFSIYKIGQGFAMIISACRFKFAPLSKFDDICSSDLIAFFDYKVSEFRNEKLLLKIFFK